MSERLDVGGESALIVFFVRMYGIWNPSETFNFSESFVDMLRQRVGGLITLSNIATDLQISPKTAKVWLEVLERMYLLFSIRPYTRSLPSAVLKPPKVYFFDNADVLAGKGERFENLVATSLLKRLHFLEDRDGYRYELRYLRDKEGGKSTLSLSRKTVLRN